MVWHHTLFVNIARYRKFMNHHILHILDAWHTARSAGNWVLALISHTEGHAYRKAGSLMFLSDTGKQIGMLSGGCLESDLQLQALRVLENQKPRTVVYDGNDEDNIMWQLGVGCGGRIEIALLPIPNNSHHLQLNALRAHLQARKKGCYKVSLTSASAEIVEYATEQKTRRINDILYIPFAPPPHLTVFGAGLDSQPLIDIAVRLGWSVTLIEHRAGRNKPKLFHEKVRFLYAPLGDIPEDLASDIDACIICTHNVESDAQALIWTQNSSARYCGLLGPKSRARKVMQTASLRERDLTVPIASPAGLALGGDLPESIALSIIAECHAVLYGGSALAFSSIGHNNDPA